MKEREKRKKERKLKYRFLQNKQKEIKEIDE